MTRAEPFYTAIFKAFDIECVYIDKGGRSDRSKATTVGYGKGDDEPFCLFLRPTEAHAAGRSTHLAFNAPNRKAVDVSIAVLPLPPLLPLGTKDSGTEIGYFQDFYAAALQHGGTGDGAAGLRPEIHPNYYCCFVYDPDGNRLEAVFQQDEKDGAP